MDMEGLDWTTVVSDICGCDWATKVCDMVGWDWLLTTVGTPRSLEVTSLGATDGSTPVWDMEG